MKLKQQIVQIYLLSMFGLFPLYYHNKYYDMGEAKYGFFKWAAIGLFVGMILANLLETDSLFIENLKKKIKEKRWNLCGLDKAMIAYTAVTVFSWIFSPFRSQTWSGSPEWHMGLLSQLLFCGIYFVVSRHFFVGKWMVAAAAFSTSAVFLIAYLHRFQIDPLKLYEGVSLKNQIEFLGTIGQATWYSSYLAVILPLGMGIYLWGFRGKDKKSGTKRFFLAMLLFLGVGTSVTQNSDSIYVGLSFAMLFFLWFCMENMESWKRYLEILLIGSLAAKFTGILQTAFPERVPKLGKISLAVTKGPLLWYVIAIIGVMYLVSVFSEYKGIKEERRQKIFRIVKKLRWLFFGIAAAGFVLIPIGIWMVTEGKLSVDDEILKNSGYLVFNDRWGNRRGKNWKYAVKVLKEYSLSMKLFGCGPDGMGFYSEAFHYEEMRKMWKETIVTNAHNEWLTALVNYGFLGAISYLTIFVTAIGKVCKNREKYPGLLAAGGSVIAYMTHNFFCYQQCVCTPLIFIVIGAVSYYTKNHEGDICQNIKNMLK